MLTGAAGFYAWLAQPPAANNPAVPAKAALNTAVANTIKQTPENFAAPLAVPKEPSQESDPEPARFTFQQLQALPTQEVWHRWQLLLRQNSSDFGLATAALIEKLRKNDPAARAIYHNAAALLKNPAISSAQRAQLISLLGETSTPEALTVLAKMLQETTDEKLSYAIADAIANSPSGLGAWELKFHPELSPILESLWQKLQPDQHIANAIATRIAREGAPSGIKLIFAQLGQDGKTVAEIVNSKNPLSLAALQAVAEVRNPDLLPLLKQTMQSQALDSAAFYATGTALSAMADAAATKILLDWARQAPDTEANQAQQWLGNAAASDPDSSQLLKASLLQNDVFQSSQVKAALLAVMAERD